ncbi:MAG: ferritin-like domain-containing protein [Candidatus Abyssobacteria bacterium SURF_5]|uniref:Ferritin-like domain-containing protein n=1 Tax=Abyssobacteria bacterium (strain SURF_5) TaxID=2093360 RepID=A0A3A4NL57_ABYX5|nr:MAG: ferritin-like domain-containing protein [Candidatus Abyssubacteria bacterium SURF_5]
MLIVSVVKKNGNEKRRSPLDTKETAKKLSSLVQLDIDAEYAYGQAIDEIKEWPIKNRLIEFRDDHKRHVAELSVAIRELGETPPEYKRDTKGFLLEGFTAIRSKTGTEGALKAMRSNEKTTNKSYNKARSWDVTPSIKALIEKNYEDERRHLEYIETALETKLWKKTA